MGRWGWRLFEGDQDLDIVCAFEALLDFGKEWDFRLPNLVNQTDMLAPHPMRAYYKSPEYQLHLERVIIPYIRTQLEKNGLGDRLFTLMRSKEAEVSAGNQNGRYYTIVLGAVMMRAGATIKPENMKTLRELVDQVPCRHRYALPIGDEGFRGPGRAQFLAALDHYESGVPRNFQVPSCFQCGKIKKDTGNDLKRCKRCEGAWYCDRECQSVHWKRHKPNCIPLDEARLHWLNV